MPLHSDSQQRLPGLPAWCVRLSFSMPVPGVEIFPPTGFIYINIYRNRLETRQEEAPPARADMTLSVRIAGVAQNALLPCRMVVGGLLSRGPALMDYSGVGEASVLALHPVVAYHVLAERLDLVSDAFLPLSEIIGRAGEGLDTQLEDGKVFGWEEDALKRFLYLRIADKQHRWAHDPIFRAVNLIIRQKGLIRARDLASEMCMSPRNFERQFLLKTGIRPKVYINIWRFQTAMQLLRAHPYRRLGDLVHDAGYYDVPHFLKDLKHKTGEGYEAYLKQIPDLASTFLRTVQDRKVAAFLQ